MIARNLIVAVSCGILFAPLTPGRTAGAGSRYTEPDFSARLFNPDALSLEDDEREAIVSALAALAGPMPGTEPVGNLVRMKALAVALRLDNMHARARQANDALMAGGTPDLVDSGYERAEDIANFLMAEALRLREARSEEEDALFYPFLMEIAQAVDPGAREEGREKGRAASWGLVLAAPGGSEEAVEEPSPTEGRARSTVRDKSAPIGAGESKAPANPEPGGEPVLPMVTPAVEASGPAVETSEPEGPVIEFKRREAALRVVVFEPGRKRAVPCLLSVLLIEGERESGASPFYSEAGIRPEVMDQLKASARLLEGRHSATLRVGRFHFELISLEDGRTLPLREPRLGVTLLFLLDALITGANLDDEISLGGSLPSANGRVRPRGRWAEIVKAAGRGGAKALIVSSSAEVDLTDLLVSGEITPLLLAQAVELVDPAGVGAFLSTNRDPNAAKALTLFSEVKSLLGRFEPAELVANAKVQERFREILDLFPDHLSAKLLLKYGSGSFTKRMSLRGSVRRVDDLLAPVRGLEVLTNTAMAGSSQDDRCADSMFALRRSRTSLAEGAISYCDAAVDLVVLIRAYLKISNRSTKAARDKATQIASAKSRVENLRRGLGTVLEGP